MALEREIYKAFEDVVGQENISDDPAEMHAYAFHFGRAREKEMPDGSHLFFPLPAAVVLPASTEEVQMIVKSCNRYGLRFKALSTGWGMLNASGGGKSMIQIDLRRMNRIIEINERNMYAVVEPYVISAKLQAELMKRGLTCNIIGAGSNTTALAPTKDAGYGFQGASCSLDSRNVLSVEWVLPTGDIIRTGSLGAGAGWSYSEGPGPSLRGVLRGQLSARGGIGVFTKAALKVYHWAGPTNPQIEGKCPTFSLKITPDMLLKLIYIHFPTSKHMAEAFYKLSESEICYICNRYGSTQLALALSDNNEEADELIDRLQKEIAIGGFIIVIAANSPEEFAYRNRVLQQIMEETEARSLPLVEEPRYQGLVMWRIIRASVASKEVFRPTGAFTTSFGGLETIDFQVNRMDYAIELKKNLIAKGKIMARMEDFNWGNAYECGHISHIDNMIMAHPTPEGIEGMVEFTEEATKACVDPELKYHTGGPHLGVCGDVLHDAFGPANSNYHLWLRQLKKAFDPNGTAEANHYITPDDEYKSGYLKT
jgi:hypothetical protein